MEKLTRVLTVQENQILDQDWVGRDGSKRKVEVCRLWLQKFLIRVVIFCAVDYGETEIQEIVSI